MVGDTTLRMHGFDWLHCSKSWVFWIFRLLKILATLRAAVGFGGSLASQLVTAIVVSRNKFSPSSKMMRKQAYETNHITQMYRRGLDEFWLSDIEQAMDYWDACLRAKCLRF